MNICEYKNAMNEIFVDTAAIQASLQKKLKEEEKNKIKKTIPYFAIAAIILVLFMFLQENPVTEPVIVMTVYAAESKEVRLSEEFTNIITTANPFIGSSSLDDQGNPVDAEVNYDINFVCEGEGIRSITYYCYNKEITRNYRSDAPAYYVQNIKMPVDEYRNYIIGEDEQFLYGFYGEGEEEAHVTRLIGASYTVTYEDQTDRPYGLIVAAEVTEEGSYHFEDFVITVEIELTDGSVIEKKLQVHSEGNAFEEIEIRIL